jgi:hypothetical protein
VQWNSEKSIGKGCVEGGGVIGGDNMREYKMNMKA